MKEVTIYKDLYPNQTTTP